MLEVVKMSVGLNADDTSLIMRVSGVAGFLTYTILDMKLLTSVRSNTLNITTPRRRVPTTREVKLDMVMEEESEMKPPELRVSPLVNSRIFEEASVARKLPFTSKVRLPGSRLIPMFPTNLLLPETSKLLNA